MSYTHAFAGIKNRPVAGFGAGTLGRRIPLMFASRGGTVRVYDPTTEQATAATEYVAQTLPEVVHQHCREDTCRLPASGEVGLAKAAGSVAEALDDAWLVVEAVPEKLEIKIPLWGKIDDAAPADTTFATNSSSSPARWMAEKVRDKARLCNMHFYMPPRSNAVDLMSDGQNDRGLLDNLFTVLPTLDIHPFEAKRESVGFIFNRIWAAIKRESLAVVAEGVAGPDDVDGMFKLNWHM